MKKSIEKTKTITIEKKKTKTHLSHLSLCQQPGEHEKEKNTQ